VQLRGLGAVAFTGSRATGRRVAYAVAAGVGTASDDRHPLPPRMIMELGGKDAVYVRADVVGEHPPGSSRLVFNEAEAYPG